MKKVLSILFSAFLVFSLGTSAFAASNSPTDYTKGLAIVDEANGQIQEKIDKALEKANKVYQKYESDLEKVNNDTDKSVKLTQKYNDDIKEIMANLYDESYSITVKGIDKAAKYGIKSVCEITYIDFNGKLYPVDPIRVVGYGEDPLNNAE